MEPQNEARIAVDLRGVDQRVVLSVDALDDLELMHDLVARDLHLVINLFGLLPLVLGSPLDLLDLFLAVLLSLDFGLLLFGQWCLGIDVLGLEQ